MRLVDLHSRGFALPRPIRAPIPVGKPGGYWWGRILANHTTMHLDRQAAVEGDEEYDLAFDARRHL